MVRDVNLQNDSIAKFEGFDIRGTYMGSWIFNNGGFQNTTNLQVEEADIIYHKYNLTLVTGG